MSRTTPTRKQQTTLTPAVAAAAKDAAAKKQANEKKKEQLHATIEPVRKPAPRTHADLMRAGLMLEQQRLRALCDDATNKAKLMEELEARRKSLDDHVTRRDNLNKAIREKTGELKALQEKVDSLPEENTVRLELFGIEAILTGQMEVEQPPEDLEWNGGEVFQVVTTPLMEEGEEEEQDPLARELLGSS